MRFPKRRSCWRGSLRSIVPGRWSSGFGGTPITARISSLALPEQKKHFVGQRFSIHKTWASICTSCSICWIALQHCDDQWPRRVGRRLLESGTLYWVCSQSCKCVALLIVKLRIQSTWCKGMKSSRVVFIFRAVLASLYVRFPRYLQFEFIGP